MNEKILTVRKFVANTTTAFFIFYALLSVITGALLSAMLTDKESYLVPFLVALPLFIIALVVQASNQLNFPAAMIDEIGAELQLSRLENDIVRRRSIDKYIERAIESLNTNTCSITREQMDELCAADIDIGLQSVLDSVVASPNSVLGCDNSSFTIGAYLQPSTIPAIDEELIALIGEAQPDYLHLHWYAYRSILRDDFTIEANLPVDLEDISDLSGLAFDVGAACQRTRNNHRLFITSLSREEGNLTLITAPIPEICAGSYSTGVLFFITDEISETEMPLDLERILLIFNRILANWLAKYDDCNLSRLNQLLQDFQIEDP